MFYNRKLSRSFQESKTWKLEKLKIHFNSNIFTSDCRKRFDWFDFHLMKFREDSYQIYGIKLQANDFFVSIVKIISSYETKQNLII